MKIKVGLNQKSIKEAIERLKTAKKQLPKMIDELLYESCLWVKNRANFYLENSGLNSGFISELEQGWQPIEKKGEGHYVLTNYGRAYSVEFGIGKKGEGTYEGSVPTNYEYNVQSRYKNHDGSWIFRVDNIDTLDIKQENVLPRKNTGEIIYEEGKTIRTEGQEAVMFCYNAIVDIKDQQIAKTLWERIKIKYWG